ncbi:maleylpyruvate isomerase family mycothiol-dependent enzyme [Actinocrispum sp. NPDC049592]|uniref:maleylpyruvate isomerase family mycothiol-dependent enzyme n=1 Tax=Actinocrispum sp. NPDC049592 TaxID=3154835 RepID=UPI0034462650
MKDTVVRALDEEWASIDGLLAGLPDAEWSRPTSLPGWSVQDVVSHIVGAELGLCGQTPPMTKDVKAFDHVRNEIGVVNEYWVDWLRDETPQHLHDLFREATSTRSQTLQAMPAADFQAPCWTPSGEDTYARYMRIRVFDCWMHEQDIRDAVGRKGNETGLAAELSLDEITAAMGYIVGKRAQAPSGSTVTIQLTGPIERSVNVSVDGRAKVVETLDGPATTTLAMDSTLFTRLCGGRTPIDDRLGEIRFDGDQELGHKVAKALPFTI